MLNRISVFLFMVIALSVPMSSLFGTTFAMEQEQSDIVLEDTDLNLFFRQAHLSKKNFNDVIQDPQCILNVAMIYYRGDGSNIPQNYEKAGYWCEHQIKKGGFEGHYILGEINLVKKDNVNAYNCFLKAIQRMHCFTADAHYQLGLIYCEDMNQITPMKLGSQNLLINTLIKYAIDYFNLSYKAGKFDAIYRLGILYTKMNVPFPASENDCNIGRALACLALADTSHHENEANNAYEIGKLCLLLPRLNKELISKTFDEILKSDLNTYEIQNTYKRNIHINWKTHQNLFNQPFFYFKNSADLGHYEGTLETLRLYFKGDYNARPEELIKYFKMADSSQFMVFRSLCCQTFCYQNNISFPYEIRSIIFLNLLKL